MLDHITGDVLQRQRFVIDTALLHRLHTRLIHRHRQITITAGRHFSGAISGFIQIHHLSLLQRQRLALFEQSNQLAGTRRGHRIHRRVNFAAGRNAHHRQRFRPAAGIQRIEHISGGAITAGKQQQVDIVFAEPEHSLISVTGRGGGRCLHNHFIIDARLCEHIRPHRARHRQDRL